ncbi:DNA replication protein [Rahnella bonaserana]
MANVSSLAKAREARRPQESPNIGGKGYALLHRKITELPFYRNDSEAVHLWVHIILSANYAPTVVPTEFGDMLLRRGEFITGRNKLELETGVDCNRIKYLLNKFEKMGMISRITTKKFTRLFVVKYDDYQPNFVPTECQQNSIANPDTPRASVEVVPSECQQSATANELNNNSITNVIESPSVIVKAEKKKPSFSCEDVVSAYHEILPEAKGIRALSDKRRNLIRTFWAKASKITRQLDSEPFTLDSWKAYLKYISTNCRWMLEDRPDSRSGKTWQKKGLEYFLNDETYLQVREGAKDDR